MRRGTVSASETSAVYIVVIVIFEVENGHLRGEEGHCITPVTNETLTLHLKH
jgi:hypothetical protein